MPATGSRWPTTALMPPTVATAESLAPLPPSAWPRARASVGSPSCVPVPCSSIASVCAASLSDADEQASRTRLDCAEPLGAVRLALRPSCRTALPSSVQKTSAVAPAHALCSQVTQPTPSPRPYPFALASNVLQRPSGASIPARAEGGWGEGETTCCPTHAHLTEVVAVRTRLTVVASTMDASPAPTARAVLCNTTRADEHAVSMLWHGPCIPNAKEMRPAATEIEPPVAA
eukprot:33048-Prymnesium_polylepis.1